MGSNNLSACRQSVFALGLSVSIFATANLVAEDVFFRSDGGMARGAERGPNDVRKPFDLASPTWKCSLASGHSTPTVFDDFVALTTYDADREELAVLLLERTSGRTIWSYVVETDRVEPFHHAGSPAASTVASDGDRLFAFFGSFGLIALDMQGRPLWQQPMGPFQDEFGAASSPVLAGDLVIVNQDHDTNNALFAFSKETGERKWRVDRNEFTRSYATPVVAKVDGKLQLIVAGSLTLTGYDVETGSRLWWLDGLARIVNPTPVVHEGVAYVATWAPGGDAEQRVAMDDWARAQQDFDANGDQRIQKNELLPGPVLQRFFRMDLNQDGGLDQREWEKHAAVFEHAQNALHAVRLGGTGDLSEQILWSQTRGLPFVASPVLANDLIFMVKDGGILTAVSSDDGSMQRRGRLKATSVYYASPLFDGSHVYIPSVSGVMNVVSANPEWSVIDEHDFQASIYATPVVVDDQLYVRTSDALYRFDR